MSLCANWLPASVDVAALPPGQPKPVQLDPVAYEPDTYLESFHGKRFLDIRLNCNKQGLLDVVEAASQTNLYQLKPTSTCLTNPIAAGENGVWKSGVGDDPIHKLLAVYDNFKLYTTIWSLRTSPAPDSRLNTYGYRLEFMPDGQQLRARNRALENLQRRRHSCGGWPERVIRAIANRRRNHYHCRKVEC